MQTLHLGIVPQLYEVMELYIFHNELLILVTGPQLHHSNSVLPLLHLCLAARNYCHGGMVL